MPDSRELARIGLAHVDRVGARGAQRPQRAPPAGVEYPRGVTMQARHARHIAVRRVDLTRPGTGADHMTGAAEAPMQDLQQRGQQDQIPDPAEPDDDRLHGGCRHDSSPLWEAHKLFGSGRPWQASHEAMRAFAWFLALMALALAAIAVFSYPAWTLLHPFFDFPFHPVCEPL